MIKHAIPASKQLRLSEQQKDDHRDYTVHKEWLDKKSQSRKNVERLKDQIALERELDYFSDIK